MVLVQARQRAHVRSSPGLGWAELRARPLSSLLPLGLGGN